METKDIFSGISVFIIILILVLSATTAFGQEIDKASPKLATAAAETECEKNKGMCIYFQNNCSDGYSDSNMACKTRSEKCCVKICPEDCKCMTEAEAKNEFNGNYERCSDDVCGYGYTPTAAAMIKNPKYCFKEKISQVQCPQGCECLNDEEAKEKGLALCNNTLIRCEITTTAGALQDGHCYEKPVSEVCPEDCKCMTEAEARAKFNGNYERCSDGVCGYGYTPTAAAMIKNPKYCFKEKLLPVQCPQGCECLNDDAAKEKGMVLCKNEWKRCIIPAATGAAVQYGHCYEREVNEMCHYDSRIGKCSGLCPEDKVCKRFYIVSENMVRDEDTGMDYSVDSFFDVFVEVDIPGTAVDSFFDVFTELSIEGGRFAPGKTACKCVSTKRCQYDAIQDRCIGGCPEGMKCRTFLVVSTRQVKDADTDELLTPDEAGLSSNEIVIGKKVCKCVPLVQVRCKYDAEQDRCVGGCPEGMKCRMFQVLSRTQVKDVNTGEILTARRELTKGDDDDIVFLTPEYNPYEQMGSDTAIEVRFATNELVVGRRVCKCIKALVKECPQGCECLVEEKAKSKFNGNYELCADYNCGTETVIKPDGAAVQVAKQCFKGKPSEDVCPQGCICLKRDEGEKKGLSICPPSATECKITGTNEWGICFKLGEKDCRYDYDNNACVGTCPPGQKCQLNTIYRDPTTGKVTYAECNCKAPPVEECPDNCKCLTKMEGYKQGLDVCNNKVTICDYITTDALTTAAPNALGVPKYCFGEKVYAKCQDNCDCMKREEAYEKGYELCGGVVRECSAGLYCFWKPLVEECGKDTLSVVRKINPKSVSPPAYVDVYLSVKPIKTLNGIIITEKIPKGMEPAWDYAVVSFDPEVEQKIEASSFAMDVVTAIEAKWTSRKPDSWDPDTREAKWILKDNNGIKPQTFMYKLKVKRGEPIPPPDPMNPAGGSKYGFKGNWLISSGETCPIIGDEIVEIKPSEGWPPCPISDLELLRYIDMWARGELTDMQMLQAIKIWATAPPCPEFAYGTLKYGVNVKEVDKATPKLAESGVVLPGEDVGVAPGGSGEEVMAFKIHGKSIIVGSKLYQEVVGGAEWDPGEMPIDPLGKEVILIGGNYYKEVGEAEGIIDDNKPGEAEGIVIDN